MRPWMMALASGIAAIAAAAALAMPELTAGTPDAVLSGLLARAPALAIAGIGVYAFAAMLASTASLVGTSLATRRRLARLMQNRNASEPDWTAAFGTTGLRRLWSPLAPASPGRAALTLDRPFNPRAARREIGRLHYIWLARTHFFSALIVLAGIMVVGLVQTVQPMPIPATIPAVATAVVVVAALLFAALCRLALDIAAEPLIEAMSRLPVEHLDTVLLRRIVELLEHGRPVIPTPGEASAPGRQLAEQVVAAIDQGHEALLAAIGELSARTAAVPATIEAAAAAVDGAIRAIEIPAAPPVGGIGDETRLIELRVAVEALTAVIERFVTASAEADDPSVPLAAAEDVPRSTAASPRLARELRQLLREIETAP